MNTCPAVITCAAKFEPAHRSQSGFQPSVIGFDRVVSVLLGDVTGGRRELIEHPRIGGRAISGDLDRGRPVIKGAGEESASRSQIPQNVRRGHYELGSDTDPKHRLMTAFTELAHAI